MSHRVTACLLLLFSLVGCSFTSIGAPSLDQSFIFYAKEGQTAPTTYPEVTDWMSSLDKADGISLTGGSYWVVIPTKVYSRETNWVINVRNSILESLDYTLLGSNGSKQYRQSGYYAPYEFLFDYGREVELDYGVDYWFVIRMESRYFSSIPKVELEPYGEYKASSDIEAMLVMLCLGGLLFIACYNLLIYFSIRDRAFLYYGLYVITYFTGWALTFHLGAHLWDFHSLEIHHLFFIGLPIFNILFYKHFLQLPEYSPKLWRLSKLLMWTCILALPTSIFLVSYTALIASVLIMLWIALAITCGNVCLIKGFYPARYFIFAFTCLLLPAVIILPGNMGITSDFIENAELATLIGGTVDALMLSLALAYKIKLLSEERQNYIETLDLAWEKARQDQLTQLPNRHAFDEYIQSENFFVDNAEKNLVLILLDLDGLKQVNHTLGHHEGDSLLVHAGKELKVSCDLLEKAKVFRIGGDNFVILISEKQLPDILKAIEELSNSITNQIYKNTGISFGYALNTKVKDAGEWLRAADRDMYKRKTAKRREMRIEKMALQDERLV
ncbi:GGDEF domain-containing protein [Shewanella sp. D64]|uniref:sensor domain-containing diguanylate cyclase n=1 Tax=unclassified Shewanella TaxID=196818 RepID=UPI0022BA2D20|nr:MULTISPECIES: diguanylate cyclase [unclassified Shewanella]MEC4726460.1 GGDEF domain-containing protein [Shewanella sp. D64]MEC4738472.1 GGDEF domain-containing protein [Shewanella sp. E94]WBJ94127.1 GGDEF domain-containing protein [Shewanella sp. MTB7]